MSEFLLHGFHAVSARLARAPQSIRTLWVDAARHDGRMENLLRTAQAREIGAQAVSAARLDALVPGGRHQGVVAEVDRLPISRHWEELLDAPHEPPLFLLLDEITDPHNLGACLRVADAMGVHAVLAPRDHAVAINATVARVSAGASEHIPYFTVTNLARTLRALREAGLWIVGLAGEGDATLYDVDPTGPLAWVLGAEGKGLRRLTREHCDMLCRIPQYGTVESLNVSVACGICLAESRRRRHEAISSAAVKR